MFPDNNNLEVLSDHYKDSVDRQDENLKKRDAVFSMILAVVFLMLFGMFLPGDLNGIVRSLSTSKLGFNGELNVDFVNSIIWFILLSLVIKYLQLRVNIERLYEYIHYLESELNRMYFGRFFTRESKSYLAQYPVFLEWVHFLYNVFFPFLLAILILMKIVSEWISVFKLDNISHVVIVNTIFFIFIIVSLVLAYCIDRNKKI